MFILFIFRGFLNHPASCEKWSESKTLSWEDSFYCTREQLLKMIQNNPSVFQQPNLNYCFFCCKIVFYHLFFFIQFNFLYSFFLLSRNLSIFLMTLLSCLQLPKMQCNKNVCLHMDMYYLQDYIIAKMFLLVTRSWYIAAVQELCVIFQYFSPYTGNV